MVVNVGCSSGNQEARIVEMVHRTISLAVFTVTDLRITYCNQAFLSLFELSNLEKNAITIDDVFSQPGTFEQLQRQCEIGAIVNVMVQCKINESQTFWALLCLTKSEDAEGVYYSGTLQDQRDIIDREKLLKQRNEDLKKLNSQLDRFIYSASHDIRQPIASIMGLIHLMQMEEAYAGNDYLGKIHESVVKLDHFLTKIMQFSKNSHEHIGSQHIDFTKLFETDLATHACEIQAKRISVSLEVSEGYVFYSDADRLAVAIFHVIKNCFDFCDTSKPDPYIKIIVTTYASNAIIEVIDNGIGISKSHVDKVTGMFYRATERSKGSGLGLYIVNEILIKLKGTLLIDSELGLGTMVRMEIPNGVKGKLVNRKRSLTQ